MKIDNGHMFYILPNQYSLQIDDLSNKIYILKNWDSNINSKKIHEQYLKNSFLYCFNIFNTELEEEKLYHDYYVFLTIYINLIKNNKEITSLLNEHKYDVFDFEWNKYEEVINELMKNEISNAINYNYNSFNYDYLFNEIHKSSNNKKINIVDNDIVDKSEENIIENKYVSSVPLCISFSRWFMPTLSKMNTTANRMMVLLIGAYNKLYIDNKLQDLDKIKLYSFDTIDIKTNGKKEKKKIVVDIEENKKLYYDEIKKIDTNIKFKKNDFFRLLGYTNESGAISNLPYTKVEKNDGDINSPGFEYAFIVEFKKMSKFIINENFKKNDFDLWKQIEAIFGTTDLETVILDLTSLAITKQEVIFKLNTAAIPIFNAISKFFGKLQLNSITSLQGKSLIMYEALKIIQGNKDYVDYNLYISTNDENKNYNHKNDGTNSIRAIFGFDEKTIDGNYVKYNDNDRKIRDLAIKTFDDINKYSFDMLITNIEEIKKGKRVKGFSFTIQNKESKTINLLNTYDKKYKICTNLIDQITDSQRLEIYQAIESQKFRNLYFNLSDEEVEFAKPSYLKLCFDFMLQKYKTNDIRNSEIRNPVALMKFYLFNGANIYDGLNAKTKSDGIIVWTPNDSVKTALDTDINKKKKHEEEWADEPDWLKDFYKKVGEIDKHENEPLKEDWIDEWYRKAAEIKYE